MQMRDARLAGHQTCDMRFTRQSKQFIESWLTRAVVAKGQLTNANDTIDMDDSLRTLPVKVAGGMW